MASDRPQGSAAEGLAVAVDAVRRRATKDLMGSHDFVVPYMDFVRLVEAHDEYEAEKRGKGGGP